MADPTPRRLRLAAVAAALAAAVAPAGVWAVRQVAAADPPAPGATGPAPPGSTTVGGMPLFATWPKDKSPEVVLVLTGQTHGYISPCGCSRPQKGGLERRFNFVQGLRAKGWPVVALDLGDLAPAKKVPAQELLKYRYMMSAMREIGYAAVGLGEHEFNQQLYELFARYPLQQPDAPPTILCANLLGMDSNSQPIPPEKMFSGAGKKLMVEAVEVAGKDAQGKTHLPVAVTAAVGKTEWDKLRKIDPSFAFADTTAALKQALGVMKDRTKQAGLNVLLFNGTKEDALKVSGAFPDFHVILCQSDDPEPPQFPTLTNNNRTFVVQVGQRGTNVGAVGVFKDANGGYELKYQLVPMTEEFLTPRTPEAEAANKALTQLEAYREEVKRLNLLAEFSKKPLPHPAMIQNPGQGIEYVGSGRCQACHPNEYNVWKASKHSHALEALDLNRELPKLARFDGECVVCHTTGFGYTTGFKNETDTPLLKHVGCESCHGPGGGHVNNPLNKKLSAALSPWKTNPPDKLPAKDALMKLAGLKPGDPPPVKLSADQQRLVTAVRSMCMKCHDQDNDPKFELESAMPKIWHSGFREAANGGLPGGN